MKRFEKEMVMNAVKDAFLTDSYDEYSIGNGWTVVRNDDIESWEDEGITILSDRKDVFNVVCSYCVENFCDSEEEWFFEKGKVIERLVDYVYEEQLSFIETYEHTAEKYSYTYLRHALKSGEMSKDDVVSAALNEIQNILTDWDFDEDCDYMYLEEDWWNEAVPALKGYFKVIKDDCDTTLPEWIRTDIEAIQDRWVNFGQELALEE